MRITVVGTGYVGLVAGTCFAETGNEVLCLDIEKAKIERLKKGELPIYEPGLLDLFQRNTREGRLRFTSDYGEAVEHARVFFLCLPTPPAEDGSADVSYVLAAVTEIARRLRENPPLKQDNGEREPSGEAALFVLKSTVPVGTNARVKAESEKIFTGGPVRCAVASNPEFLKEGAAIEDFLKPDRVVLGVHDERSYEVLHALYEPFCRSGAPILRMDPASAELTKYAANGFLAAKISFMNEIARICEAYGADVELVRKGITSDARIGKAFLFPGLGYGGSCFPKDTRALVASARAKGADASIVDAAERINESQKTILVPKILEALAKDGGPQGKTVALWGLAFKPRTDDIREAPALAIAEKLLAAGVKIQAYDPEAMANVKRVLGERIVYAKDQYAALAGAAALVLVTEWNEFRTPDWSRVKKALARPAIFDGRNIYDPAKLRELGFAYTGIGRP
ncbi:MAG: UDP-glucose/GDP-mannose dehydrogenase family protein [Planctomycetota bacterium]|nr:UDP-glucose/GDP-mannose dehydrogenase family protein [Planctomycetota bacterium]